MEGEHLYIEEEGYYICGYCRYATKHDQHAQQHMKTKKHDRNVIKDLEKKKHNLINKDDQNIVIDYRNIIKENYRRRHIRMF